MSQPAYKRPLVLAILDGWGFDRGGVKGLFVTDAVATVIGIAVLVGMVVLTRRRPAPAPAVEPAT